MDPTFKTGSVGSRFVSQTELTEAQQRREDEVRASYARLGQSPPPEALAAARGESTTYDPRTLYERLKANKDAKQEAWDEKMKLSNQFRGIDDGESEFLAEVAREKREAERQKERETREELEAFRRAALTNEASPPLPASQPLKTTSASASPPVVNASQPAATSKSKAKRKREGLLGVVKKKPATESSKAAAAATAATPTATKPKTSSTASSTTPTESETQKTDNKPNTAANDSQRS